MKGLPIHRKLETECHCQQRSGYQVSPGVYDRELLASQITCKYSPDRRLERDLGVHVRVGILPEREVIVSK